MWGKEKPSPHMLKQKHKLIIIQLHVGPVYVHTHIHTSDPVASRMVGWAESGAQAIHSTTCSCSRSSALHSLEAVTQTRTVWSLEQLASKEPSWLGRTIRTHSLWPVNVFTQYLEMQHN